MLSTWSALLCVLWELYPAETACCPEVYLHIVMWLDLPSPTMLSLVLSMHLGATAFVLLYVSQLSVENILLDTVCCRVCSQASTRSSAWSSASKQVENWTEAIGVQMQKNIAWKQAIKIFWGFIETQDEKSYWKKYNVNKVTFAHLRHKYKVSKDVLYNLRIKRAIEWSSK